MRGLGWWRKTGVVGLAVTATLGALLAGTGPAARADGPPSALCRQRAPVWMHRFSLGAAFAGLPRTDVSLECDRLPNVEGALIVGDHPPDQTPYWSVVYGDCQAESEAGCALPLEIQSWPECARNLATHSPADDDLPAPVATPYRIPGYERLLAARVEDGWLEIYAGTTTIVVFADSDRLARRAARAIAPAAAREGRGLSSRHLRERALRSGTRCRGRA